MSTVGRIGFDCYRTIYTVSHKKPQIDILPVCKLKPLNRTRLPRTKGAAASLDACLAQQSAMPSDFRAKPSPANGRKSSTRRSMVITLSLGAE